MFYAYSAFYLYPVLAFGTLAVLGWMILRIGALLGDCPQSQARARAAAVTIATGYLAIGAGGVILGAAAAAYLGAGFAISIGVLGFVVLGLGLGFSNAVATLRAVIAPPSASRIEPRVHDPAPEAGKEDPPLEPVLP